MLEASLVVIIYKSMCAGVWADPCEPTLLPCRFMSKELSSFMFTNGADYAPFKRN
jgi:hypothetical protein